MLFFSYSLCCGELMLKQTLVLLEVFNRCFNRTLSIYEYKYYQEPNTNKELPWLVVTLRKNKKKTPSHESELTSNYFWIGIIHTVGRIFGRKWGGGIRSRWNRALGQENKKICLKQKSINTFHLIVCSVWFSKAKTHYRQLF